MRGGRNKFGPMYKRDRARKLQILRQRQLALQAIRGSIGGGSNSGPVSDGASSQLSPGGYQQPPYTNMHIKQEIQIPQVSFTNMQNDDLLIEILIGNFCAIQVSSLTSSPDSSSSPIAIALGQVTNHQTPTTATVPGNNGTTYTSSTTTNNTTLQNTITDSKLWMANSTTASPHSLSPKTFTFDSGTNPSSTADSGNSSETLRRVNVIKELSRFS